MVAEPLRIAPVREHGVAVGPAQDTLREPVTEAAAGEHAGTDQAVQVVDSLSTRTQSASRGAEPDHDDGHA